MDAARGLAERVLAGQFRKLRIDHRAGWTALVLAAACFGTGIFTLVGGWGAGHQPQGALIVVYGCLLGTVGVFNAVLAPRRIRRNAERVLQITGPVTTRSPG